MNLNSWIREDGNKTLHIINGRTCKLAIVNEAENIFCFWLKVNKYKQTVNFSICSLSGQWPSTTSCPWVCQCDILYCILYYLLENVPRSLTENTWDGSFVHCDEQTDRQRRWQETDSAIKMRARLTIQNTTTWLQFQSGKNCIALISAHSNPFSTQWELMG